MKSLLIILALTATVAKAADLPERTYTKSPIQYRQIPPIFADGLRYYLANAYMAERIADSCSDIPAFTAVYKTIVDWSPNFHLQHFIQPLTPKVIKFIEQDSLFYAAELTKQLAPQPIASREIWCQIHGNPLFEQAVRILDSEQYYMFINNYLAWARVVRLEQDEPD